MPDKNINVSAAELFRIAGTIRYADSEVKTESVRTFLLEQAEQALLSLINAHCTPDEFGAITRHALEQSNEKLKALRIHAGARYETPWERPSPTPKPPPKKL